MRRILVEAARRKERVRHGGDIRRVDLNEACSLIEPIPDDLLALDEALDRLEKIDAARARLVKLRFFAGLTIPEAAQALGISRATAERHWTFARTWLFAEISGDSSPKKNLKTVEGILNISSHCLPEPHRTPRCAEP